jgi:hypothetical protein
VDGWQPLVKDVAYWRATVKGAETATTQEERAWFEADRRLHEKLTLRDIGVWSHHVGDAAQPCACRCTLTAGETARTPKATQ